jgi:acyl-coenzyme A thioesterase PaaI-like protein
MADGPRVPDDENGSGGTMAVGIDQHDEVREWGSYLNDFDFHCDFGDDGVNMEGELVVTPAVRFEGSTAVRPAVLAAIADVVSGLPAAVALSPRLPLTLDIDVRMLGEPADRLWAASRLLKVGRTTVAAEVTFTNGRSGPLVAVSSLSFMSSPRPVDTGPVEVSAIRSAGGMTTPIAGHLGARTLAPGVVEIDRRPYVQQSSGTLQGGVVALIGEFAAQSLTGRTVMDLDIRYLAAIRVGPAQAVAAPLAGDLVAVDVRDAGNDHRLAARIFARMAPPD